MPIVMSAVLLLIMVQQVLQAELGIIPMRNTDFFNNNFHNPSLIWGPTDDEVSNVPKLFTPKIFTIVPFGEFKGQTKYWPFFWLLPTIIIFFTAFPFLLCLKWELNHIISDVNTLFKKTFHRMA
jgi:hypothetical protein